MTRLRRKTAGGGWAAIAYALRKARGIGVIRMWKALRSRNACKTCALGMGGQLGGMVNEKGRFPEVCKKSIQAMAADMQGAIHEHFFDDFSLDQLRGFSSRELESAGRITHPLYAGPLDSRYRRIDWDEAIQRIAKKLQRTDPRQAFFYLSGRSSNEAAFLMQLFARIWGTNNVNNCSYYCHQASGVALSSVTGSGTATITLDDLDLLGVGDVLFLIGANPASNHPRFMRTLVDLKRRGAMVIVINPLKELGLVRFRVPSDPRSLLFGSTIADEYLQPHIGGDIALLSGIAKSILELCAVDERFVQNHAEGWSEFRSHIESLDWEEVIHRSGVAKSHIDRVAQMYAAAPKAIFCWAMGITHHEHGVQNVQMIANLAIMRGNLGAPGRGLLPLRGHSNVQGIGSMAVTPVIKQAVFDRLQSEFNVKLPTWPGMDTLSCMHAAHDGNVQFAACLGGNLFGSNPDSRFMHEAFARLDLAVYMSTTLNTGHAWGRARETIILPVLARDEEPQPTTQESMFNYVRFSDGGPARHEGPRSEVEIIASIAHQTLGSTQGPPLQWQALSNHTHLRQLIARIIPGYQQLASIDQTKQEFTIPGRVFHEPEFPTETGRARMHVIDLPPLLGNPSPDLAIGPFRHLAIDQTQSPNRQITKSPNELRLMTIRSEGQFNTVVYEEEDIYRGQERRDVILMNIDDIRAHGLQVDQLVTVRSNCSGGTEERGASGGPGGAAMPNIRVRQGELPPGNCAMYYPEANVLIPRIADPLSRTPTFKSALVTIEPSEVGALHSPPPQIAPEYVAAARGSSRDRMNRC